MRYVDKPEKVHRLTSPLKYWQISHGEKIKYDLIYPLILTALFLMAYHLAPNDINLVGDDGLFTRFSSLLTILIPFFIAALAAVATAGREGLDDPTAGIPIKLKDCPLSRRQFVCYMFGYLAWISLALLVATMFAESFADTLRAVSSSYWPAIRFGLLTIYTFLASHMVITALYSLFYLTERLNR